MFFVEKVVRFDIINEMKIRNFKLCPCQILDVFVCVEGVVQKMCFQEAIFCLLLLVCPFNASSTNLAPPAATRLGTLYRPIDAVTNGNPDLASFADNSLSYTSDHPCS
jgi:hypothetical protein